MATNSGPVECVASLTMFFRNVIIECVPCTSKCSGYQGFTHFLHDVLLFTQMKKSPASFLICFCLQGWLPSGWNHFFPSNAIAAVHAAMVMIDGWNHVFAWNALAGRLISGAWKVPVFALSGWNVMPGGGRNFHFFHLKVIALLSIGRAALMKAELSFLAWQPGPGVNETGHPGGCGWRRNFYHSCFA